jgi:DNA-binding response OmpR family regulator
MVGPLSPRQLAGVIEHYYGARLSFQEALVFHQLIESSGSLVTYEQIEDFLWRRDLKPPSARKAIHVAVCNLRRKIPPFAARCERGQGYVSGVGWGDVTTPPPA